MFDQLETLDDELYTQGIFKQMHYAHFKTVYNYESIKKWDKSGLKCKNGKLTVLCAGKNECPNEIKHICIGWRKVISIRYHSTLQKSMKHLLR